MIIVNYFMVEEKEKLSFRNLVMNNYLHQKNKNQQLLPESNQSTSIFFLGTNRFI